MSRVSEALARAQGGGLDVGAPLVSPDAPEATLPQESAGEAEAWVSETVRTADAQPAPEAAPAEGGPAELSLNEQALDAAAGARALGRSDAAQEKLIMAPGLEQGCVEQYRRLAARLHLAQAEHGIKVVMIASALPQEGKTLTAANLALTLSESYHRNVLLIDGDLRRPSVHEVFKIPNLTGLNDGVKSDTERKVPLVHWSECLTLVTAGRPDPDPMRVLSSGRMKKVIAEAGAKFDWVIIDTPPVGLLTDASLFAAMVDTVVLVIEAGRTPHADIERAVQALGRDRIFGVVLNRTNLKRHVSYTRYNYGYGYGKATASR